MSKISPILRIAIVAGEPSGDELGAELIHALKKYFPHAEFFGVGGEKMRRQGIDSWVPLEKLAVRGYIEVIKHLPDILRIRRLVKKRVLAQRPDVYIGIDSPDFNLPLEKIFKKAGIPTVHYVGPSVWMWRKNRINMVRQAVSHLLLILPFEKTIWDEAKVPASYVGHPLADRIPLIVNQASARERLRIAPDIPVIALLPGSRLSEAEYLTDMLIESAALLYQQYPNALFLVPVVTANIKAWFEQKLFTLQAHDIPIRIVFGHAQDVMQASDVVVLASGTATLEATLLKKPMVIIYKLNRLTYHLVKNKFYLPYFGLPNIISHRFVVPELMQAAATAENIVQAVANYLSDPAICEKLQKHFMHLHENLRCDAAVRAAEAVKTLLETSDA